MKKNVWKMSDYEMEIIEAVGRGGVDGALSAFLGNEIVAVILALLKKTPKGGWKKFHTRNIGVALLVTPVMIGATVLYFVIKHAFAKGEVTFKSQCEDELTPHEDDDDELTIVPFTFEEYEDTFLESDPEVSELKFI